MSGPPQVRCQSVNSRLNRPTPVIGLEANLAFARIEGASSWTEIAQQEGMP